MRLKLAKPFKSARSMIKLFVTFFVFRAMDRCKLSITQKRGGGKTSKW